ncbi:hypothetical protein, partial [Mycobacterium colombiense]|uniref:hypothetical protein n=1 Tax=Mycobacterium colombiense TaxID=339268 RepID=UPI001C0C1F43
LVDQLVPGSLEFASFTFEYLQQRQTLRVGQLLIRMPLEKDTAARSDSTAAPMSPRVLENMFE